MVTSLGAAVAIIHGDREGDRRRNQRCRKEPSSPAATAPQNTPPIETITLRVSQHPLRPSACAVLKRIYHAPFPLERKQRPWSIRLILRSNVFASRNEPFRVRNAYFFEFIFIVLVDNM